MYVPIHLSVSFHTVDHVRFCSGFKFSQLEMSKSQMSITDAISYSHAARPTEIVLVVLLSSFKFALTDTPIVWNQAPVNYPSMSKPSRNPEMRLKVEALVE